MRRVASLCVGAVAAALCGFEASRAEDAADIVETVQLDADADLSSIADAHAQFAPVLTPSALSLFDGASYGSALVYMGIDGWQHGGSAYVGAEWSPSSESSFIFRAFASDGLDDFRSNAVTYRSETMRASLLPGYHFRAGTMDVKLFVGGDFMLRMPLQPALNAPTMLFGARASADVWWEPAKDWMLSGSASATMIERGISGRLAAGWRMPFAWVGPEVLAMHDIYNTQWRAGAHVSGFEVGLTEWSIAGGYAQDSFGRGGTYARLGISYRPIQ